MPVKKAVWVMEMWRMAPQFLFSEIGREPVVVMMSTPFVDIVAKVDAMQRETGYAVIWMSKTMRGMAINPTDNRIIADFVTITKAVNMRPRQDNVVFVAVHAVCNFRSVINVKKACPKSKMISYAYDWQHLFCPREKIHLWNEYVEGGEEYAKSEYDAIDSVIRGDTVDGVIHKDYGKNWPMLKDCKAKTLWIPPVLPKEIYQEPPPEDIADTIAYIGTIISKHTHKRSANLFEDIMLEEIFECVANQGFKIHGFVLGPTPDVIAEYEERFPDGRVKINSGRLLPQLMPILKGRFRWGWMLYHWPAEIIMPHVNVSIPIKLFSYLSLGVPILISEELKACVKIVKKYNCGIVFSQDEIKDVRAKMAQYNYADLLKGVQAAREDLCFDRFQPLFNNFIRETMEAKHGHPRAKNKSKTSRKKKTAKKKTKTRRKLRAKR